MTKEPPMTLDELAAVKVMGWTRCSDDCPATDTCFFVDTDGSVWLHGGIVPFHPSTRIVDAWEVVEKMRSMGWWWNLSSCGGEKGEWRFEVMMDHKSDPEETRLWIRTAKTAPLAITLAALRARGVTDGEIEAAQEPRP